MNGPEAIRLLARASFILEQCAPNDPLIDEIDTFITNNSQGAAHRTVDRATFDRWLAEHPEMVGALVTICEPPVTLYHAPTGDVAARIKHHSMMPGSASDEYHIMAGYPPTQENTMPNPTTPKPGFIVEDEGMVGGTDAATGAPVIRPKTTDGRADEATKATDPRENKDA